MAEGDTVLKDYYKSLGDSPYYKNGITAHDSSKFVTIIRTTDDKAVVKQSYMSAAKEFIDNYAKSYPECPLKIAIGIVDVHQDDLLAANLDIAYYDRTLVE